MIELSRQGAVTVIQANERFNEDFVVELSQALDENVAHGVPMAVLNLEATCLINSKGLEYLLDTGEKFERRGGALKLAAPNMMCREVLAISKLDHDIEVYESVNQAVRSFAK
jgi:anti-anti-sigma factor